MDENSILINVRKSLGLDPEDKAFDSELLIHINNALGTLIQNNVGVSLVVTDENQTWDEFKNPKSDNEMFESVKLYVFAKVKILFDPPPPSNVQYYQQAIDESLWRLKVAYDDTTSEGGEDTYANEFYRHARASWSQRDEVGHTESW